LKNEDSLTLDEKLNNSFYIIVSGSVDFFQKGKFICEFKEGQFIGEMLALPNFVNTNLVIARSNVVIQKFNKDQFYELLSDNVKLADKVLEFI
jgi:CRP-like cAMP-binding protein